MSNARHQRLVWRSTGTLRCESNAMSIGICFSCLLARNARCPVSLYLFCVDMKAPSCSRAYYVAICVAVLSLLYLVLTPAGSQRKPHALVARRDTEFLHTDIALGSNHSIFQRDEYSCSKDKPCSNHACCGESGYCGYGPTYCGKGCTFVADKMSMRDRWG